MSKTKLCEECRFNIFHYCEGYIFRDWSGKYEGDPSDLPKIPDQSRFWTYQECTKNSKGLKFLNLTGDCTGFELKK